MINLRRRHGYPRPDHGSFATNNRMVERNSSAFGDRWRTLRRVASPLTDSKQARFAQKPFWSYSARRVAGVLYRRSDGVVPRCLGRDLRDLPRLVDRQGKAGTVSPDLVAGTFNLKE